MVLGSRVGRRMAIHSLQPREAEQPSAIGSYLLLPFAAAGLPCSLLLDLPLSPSSWFLLLLRLLLFLFIFWWWWRWWWLSITTTDTIIIPIQIDTLSLRFMHSNSLSLSLSCSFFQFCFFFFFGCLCNVGFVLICCLINILVDLFSWIMGIYELGCLQVFFFFF